MKLRFVDVEKYGFVTEPRYWFWGWSRTPKIVARKSAVLALVRAKKKLPQGYNFKIWDAQRPRAVQLAMLVSFRRRFRAVFPRLSKKRLDEEYVFKYGARPLVRVARFDTHRNGGSFDLTVVNRKGEELYMGTDHDDLTRRAATDYFEKKRALAPREAEARKNRRLLVRVLKKTGFLNYALEWWHWSWKK